MRVIITAEGRRPLLLNSQRGMNPRDPLAMELSALQKKRAKTLEDRIRISDMEFQLHLYYDARLGPVIPYLNFKRCIQDGGKQLKLGTHVLQALHPTPEALEFPLLYPGPRDMDGLLNDPSFRDVRTVNVSGRVVERTRPIFRTWKLRAVYLLDTDRLDLSNLLESARRAADYIGLGDFRPEFGLFSVDCEEEK